MAKQTKSRWNWDLLVPLLIFTLGTILPTVILPAIPLQLGLVAVQYGLFIVAMLLGWWLQRRVSSPQGRLIGWLIVILGLLVAMWVAAHIVPAVGLIFLNREIGTLIWLGFAVLVSGFTWWHRRRQPLSWFPAILGSLWITTFLAMLARVPATAGLMVTATGNILIAFGTILGDASILIIGWRIWQDRQASHDDPSK
ncbi:hypothetical protein FD13_GL000444 [Levilactobacillus senmaizukei DSM 21775 = NBRC 103853]|uniref:Uncharacterized protein n=1 Tax=Levilactobacillus senmaizukei DSM 21775 = NBRC 103853 TaxID=1423803 RepID=A0A0R2DEM0_9LACO|nr:hypothetical protein [Levilactobacillus senmaizukei]KRN01990.1 hypothetical protein FD13_GL000444 [Levilactobacillus senmaizukei DSM 21775 = NBRC 103853]